MLRLLDADLRARPAAMVPVLASTAPLLASAGGRGGGLSGLQVLGLFAGIPLGATAVITLAVVVLDRRGHHGDSEASAPPDPSRRPGQ